MSSFIWCDPSRAVSRGGVWLTLCCCYSSSAPSPAACTRWWRCSTLSPGSTPSSQCCRAPCWILSAVPLPSWWGCCPALYPNWRSCLWKRSVLFPFILTIFSSLFHWILNFGKYGYCCPGWWVSRCGSVWPRFLCRYSREPASRLPKKCSTLQLKALFYGWVHTRETTQPSHVRDTMRPWVSDRSVGRHTSCHLRLYLLTWLLETVPAAVGQGAGYILDASYWTDKHTHGHSHLRSIRSQFAYPQMDLWTVFFSMSCYANWLSHERIYLSEDSCRRKFTLFLLFLHFPLCWFFFRLWWSTWELTGSFDRSVSELMSHSKRLSKCKSYGTRRNTSDWS